MDTSNKQPNENKKSSPDLKPKEIEQLVGDVEKLESYVLTQEKLDELKKIHAWLKGN